MHCIGHVRLPDSQSYKRAPLKIPSANRFQLKQIVKHWKTLGPHFSESFAKSQLQSPGYAPSIWLVFEKMSHRASRNEFLEVPMRTYGKGNQHVRSPLEVRVRIYPFLKCNQFDDFPIFVRYPAQTEQVYAELSKTHMQ